MVAFGKLLTIGLMAYSATATPISQPSSTPRLEARVQSTKALVAQRGIEYATIVISVTQLPADYWGVLTTEAERAAYVGRYFASQFWAHVGNDAEAATWWHDAVQGLGGRSITQFVHFISDTEFAWQAKIIPGGSATYDLMEDCVIEPLIYWLQAMGVDTTAKWLPGRRDNVTMTAEEVDAPHMFGRAPPSYSVQGPKDLFRYVGGTATIQSGTGSPFCSN